MEILEAISKILVYQYINNGKVEYYHFPEWFAETFNVPEIVPFDNQELKNKVDKIMGLFLCVIRVIDMSDEPITDEMRANIGLMHEGQRTILKVLSTKQDYYLSNPKTN